MIKEVELLLCLTSINTISILTICIILLVKIGKK